MRGTGDIPRKDGVTKGWSRRGSIRIGPEGLVAQGGGRCWSQHAGVQGWRGGWRGVGMMSPVQRLLGFIVGFSLPPTSEGGVLYF